MSQVGDLCAESDLFSKDAINQLYRRQPQRFKFVGKFNAKSASWKDFELVYLDNHLRDFARCVHCKSFVTYSSKKGTGGMLRHRCLGKDVSREEPQIKRIAASGSLSQTVIAPKPVTIVTGSTMNGSHLTRPGGQLCTLLNIPSSQQANIQTIIYNPEQGNVLNLQNLTKLGLAVQAVKTGQAIANNTNHASVSITKVEANVKKQEIEIKKELIKVERETNDENSPNDGHVEQIVSNVELNEDMSYGEPSSDSENDQRADDYPFTAAPSEVQLADLQVRHAIEEHQAKMELLRRQIEVADMQREYWRGKIKGVTKSSKSSEDDGIHSDD